MANGWVRGWRESAREIGEVAGKVFPEAFDLSLRVGNGFTFIYVVDDVHENHAFNPAGHEAGGFQRDGTAEGMADENHLLEMEVVGYGADISGETEHGPLFTVFAGIAVTGEIEGDDTIVVGEGVGLIAPEVAVACTAMHKDKRCVTMSADVVDDLHAVGRGYGVGLNGGGVSLGRCWN